MRKRHSHRVLSEDEQIARYAYLLGNVPVSVADRAYAAAFARLSPERRHELIDQLYALLPEAPHRPASDDPVAFAVFMRSLHARSELARLRGVSDIASAFVSSPPIVAYFTTGAGSVTMEQQPPWVHALAEHETAPVDGGRMQHRHSATSGEWYGTT